MGGCRRKPCKDFPQWANICPRCQRGPSEVFVHMSSSDCKGHTKAVVVLGKHNHHVCPYCNYQYYS
jgi:hypothetical protein